MELTILDLWLPILGGAVLAWLSSSVVHMVLKYHNLDYQKLENEDAVCEAVGQGKPSPGLYSLPFCTDHKEMENEELQQKFIKGPVLHVVVFENGLPKMGKLLGQQILFFLFTAVLIAYTLTQVHDAGSAGADVFRLAMTVGFLAFGWANIPFSIWYGHPWGITFRFMIDAIIYSAILAAMFCWLWPGVAA